MRIQFSIICLFSVLVLAACKSNPSVSDDYAVQQPGETEQETTQPAEEGDDRGFDPCLLNASLAVCQKE